MDSASCLGNRRANSRKPPRAAFYATLWPEEEPMIQNDDTEEEPMTQNDDTEEEPMIQNDDTEEEPMIQIISTERPVK